MPGVKFTATTTFHDHNNCLGDPKNTSTRCQIPSTITVNCLNITSANASRLPVPHREHQGRPSSIPGPPASPGSTCKVTPRGVPHPSPQPHPPPKNYHPGLRVPLPVVCHPAPAMPAVSPPFMYSKCTGAKPPASPGSACEVTSRGVPHPSPQPHPPPKNHHQEQRVTLPIVCRPAPAMPAVSPQFMYSKCTGRRRALCIGINYCGQRHELRGCINDAKHVFNFLIRRVGYKAEEIVVLTDDSPYPRSQPTRQNIIDAMQWLVRDARPHDTLFFHYSGHGGLPRDLDGYDEVIYPVDYKHHGHIVDDEMHAIMVKPLPARCRLTAIFDSCHSVTPLDLSYIYDHCGRLKGRQASQRAVARTATSADVISLSVSNNADTFADGMAVGVAGHQYDHCGRLKGRQASQRAVARPATSTDVISLSGCKNGQTFTDTFADGMAVGAASHAFIKAFEMEPTQSYREILHNIRVILHAKFSQKPQLGSSHPINTALRFIM
ncbi:caspase domain-containing protein [Mycena epipterygia]|nr:caspase domain-containing protein [Mycena epipterygia]